MYVGSRFQTTRNWPRLGVTVATQGLYLEGLAKCGPSSTRNAFKLPLSVATPRRLSSDVCHYRALGLRPTCTDEELKSAYREKVTQWHPDVFAAQREMSVDKARAAEEFRRCTEAFESIVQQRAGRGTGGNSNQRNTWTRPGSSRNDARRRHTEKSAKRGFWQRKNDAEHRRSGSSSHGTRERANPGWGSELDEFFRGVRNARSASRWADTHRNRKNTRQGNGSGGPQSFTWSGSKSEGQFMDDMHLKFGVAFADKWSNIFQPSQDKDKPFRSSTAARRNGFQYHRTRAPPKVAQHTQKHKQNVYQQPGQSRERLLRDELEELNVLYTDGALTEEEYDAAKAVVVAAGAEAEPTTGINGQPKFQAEPQPESEPESTAQLDPFVAAEIARAKLAWRSNQSRAAHAGVSAMQEGAAVGHPLMCVAAAKAGRDDIVQTALAYFASQSRDTTQMNTEHQVVCAQMFAASLCQRPAEVAIAELLLSNGAVTTIGLLPTIPGIASPQNHRRQARLHSVQQQGYHIGVATSDPRSGGRLTSRTLGSRVTALHLVVAAAAADPQPPRTARRLLELVQALLDPRGPYGGVRPNTPTSGGSHDQQRHMPLAICGWNGDHGVKAAKILLQAGAVATTEILLQAEGWSMRRLLLQTGKAELPVKRSKYQRLWHDDNRRPAWMQPYYTAFDESY